MSAGSPLPATVEVRELVEGLLGREIDLTAGAAPVDPAATGAVVGVYVDDRLALRALVVVDLPLAAHAGAAIALLPSHVARSAVEDDRLSPALYENAAEILNVAASLFNRQGAPHVRLHAAHAPREVLPADVASLALAYVHRLDLAVAVSGYGSGRVSILVL
ncbi:hypothetical protein [Actinotalea sp.]|uniref:hypothetical protein n=1 Tax=Actinotalea sp. TaxID=1872145 RepID=UPI003562A8CE